MSKARAAFYVGLGSVLSHYDMDVENFSLTKRGHFTLPNNVQYAWPHSDKPILYVASSSRVPRGSMGSDHSACALNIADDGSLSILGERVTVASRPVSATCDNPTRHLLIAHGRPGTISVIRIKEDGSLGEMVEQRPDVDVGVFPHDVRMTPDNRFCIAVARGNPAYKGWWSYKDRQKDAGFLKVFEYQNGLLGRQTSITVEDGLHFGPRNLDFHPSGPWAYLTLETQNEVVVYRRGENGLEPTVLQRFSTLENPEDILVHQGLGTVHVHPRGHVVYFANRGSQPMPYKDGKEILTGVDNTLLVCAIDQRTGLLEIIQRIDSGGISARTFGLDPSGRMLIAANAENRWVKQGGELKYVSANLSTFKVLGDGRLELKHRYDVQLPYGRVVWAGVVPF